MLNKIETCPIEEMEEVVTPMPFISQNHALPLLRDRWHMADADLEALPLKSAICVTMHNEDMELFKRTMQGIAETRTS
jgi:hypothetical protein